MLCNGVVTNTDTKYAYFALADRGHYNYSYTDEGFCVHCTNHRIDLAPPFYIKASITVTGYTNPYNYVVHSTPSTATIQAHPGNDQSLLGDPC